jgi:DNA-binding GntR family transcriptional regulator
MALAERFGASRTPVREALQRLQRDGLVERVGRFYRVIHMDERDMAELGEVREALESMALHLAAQRDPSLVQALDDIVERHHDAHRRDAVDQFSELDGLFHLRIAEGSGNPSLLQHLGMLHDKITLIRNMEQWRPLWHVRVLDQHRRIVDALRRGQPDIAAGELRYHIRSVVALRTAAWAGTLSHARDDETPP